MPTTIERRVTALEATTGGGNQTCSQTLRSMAVATMRGIRRR